MRPDLDKCTTECYRRGAGSLEHTYKIKFGGTVRIDPDPEHEYDNERGGFHSSARHRHKECKDFGDNLGALRGNLRANVGRPWNDVFSEFCASLDRRSVNGHHIWTHLKWEVELNTVFLNGEVYTSTKRLGYRGDPVDGYYVHPVTGILEYKKPKSWSHRRRQDKEVTKVNLADGSWFEKIDGLWFHLKMIRKECKLDWMLHPSVTEVVEKKSANRKEISWIKERMMGKN